MQLQRRSATPLLRSVVRCFSERQATLGAEVVTVPLAARPDQLIEFYLQDRYRVAQVDAPAALAPEIVVVGPQGRPGTRLHLSGDLTVFTIHFQPGGLNALFGVSMAPLAGQGIAASDVIGGAAQRLRDAVLGAAGFDARVTASERWLGKRMAGIDAVARAAALLRRSGGRVRIDALARHAGLSDRQFTRRFEQQVGLPPKLFARTVRLNAVLDAKAALPQQPWTALAHDAGYADQAHFVRDCRALTGSPPHDFFRTWAQAR